MTITTAPRTAPPTAARTFLDALAAQDFTALAGALDDDVHLSALVPSGLVERDGPDQVGAAFARWFGGTDAFALVDADTAAVGTRTRLRWRLHVRAERLGEGWFVVEQQAYADTSAAGRISRIALVCSGFRPEAGTHDTLTGGRS
jgi:hypothetical protein